MRVRVRTHLLAASLLFVGGPVEAADYFVCPTPEDVRVLYARIRDHAVGQATSDSRLSAQGYLAAVRNGFAWWPSEEEYLTVFLTQFTPCRPARTLGGYELDEWLGTTEVGFVGSVLHIQVNRAAPPDAREDAQNVWVVDVRATENL